MLEVDEQNAFVERYSEDGEFAGDTWSLTAAEAHEQIAFEFPGQTLEWHEVPAETEDVVSYALALPAANG